MDPQTPSGDVPPELPTAEPAPAGPDAHPSPPLEWRATATPEAGPLVRWGPPALPPPVPGAPGLSFADTTSRAGAYIFDSVILLVPALIVGAILGRGGTSTLGPSSDPNALSKAFQTPADPLQTLILMGLGAAYFVLSWSGGRRATPAQRAFHLQVGNAVDGRPLSTGQAVRRWLGFGTPLGLLALIPGFVLVASGAQLIWSGILLISVASSPTRRGLHDGWAGSAVVRPSDHETSGLVVACVVVIVLLVALSVIATAVLIILGPQILAELSRLGRSI